jgi:hypothetical protein
MKQKIYILGLITALIVFVGTVFKVNHWPGAAVLLIVGISTLLIILLPVALINHYRNEGNRQNLMLYLVTWLTCFVVFTAMLFKILHWPGAGYFLLIALPFPYVVFLPVFLVVTSKNKNFNIYNTVFILFLLAGQSVFSAFLALGVSSEKINDSLAMSAHYNRVEKVLIELPGTTNNVSAQVLKGKADELLKLVNECQDLLYKEAGTSKEQWNKNPETVKILDSRNTAAKVMLQGMEPQLATRLETGLNSFVQELGKTPGCEEMAKVAPVLFDIRELNDRELPWTSRMFGDNYLSWVLVYLDALEVNIITLKNEISVLNTGRI